MPHRYAELAFTPAVKAVQDHYGALHDNERYQSDFGPNAQLTQVEAAFIAHRDHFYQASVGETGWPYVQHRGGPPGFLKPLNPKTLAYADFRGNRQYISAGNVAGNDRVALFLVDYPSRQRLKILGRIKLVDIAEADPKLVNLLRPYPYRAAMERVALITVEAFDWNCNQHITPRYTDAQLRQVVGPLEARIATLEAELAAARAANG